MSDRALKVLLLTSAFPPTVGGAETYAATVAGGLADRGHDVLVFTDEPGPAEEPVLAHRVSVADGYAARLIDTTKLRWEQMYFSLLPDLRRSLGNWIPDVILANNHETAILAKIVSLETGAPVVSAFHEHDPESEPYGMGRLAFVYGTLSPRAVIAGSRFYEARALSHAEPERVFLVHHGVDTAVFRPSAELRLTERERLGVGADEILLVCAGRYKQRKGQLELLQAQAALANPRVRTVLAGSTSSASREYEDQLQRLRNTDALTGRVDFVSVERADMPALLGAADLVVQPSHEEGLGLSVLEAMACERPVLTCNVAGIEEILTRDDIALLAPPGDAPALCEALRDAIQGSQDLSGMARRARAHVLRWFSLSAMLDATESVLVAAAASGP